MLRIALEHGLDLLVASGGELDAGRRAGAPGSRIALHGNNKSDDELRSAVAAGVRFVTIDDATELERLDAIARDAGTRQDVLLRVIPGVGAGAHRAIRTGGAGTKFGIPLDRIAAVVSRALGLEGVRPIGIHAHIGSQVLEPEPYLEEVDVVLDLLARLRTDIGFEAQLVDLGGGFGVAYTDERPIELEAFAPRLLARVHDGAAARGIGPLHTLVEPGRSVIGAGMVTLYRVGTIKEIDGRTLVAVDGGMSDNVRPMLYDARYTVAPASPSRAGAPVVVDVVGKHCETGDVLAREVKLPAEIRSGDLLAFAATGAYTYSMASNYNRIGRPAVVAVREGAVTPWLRRETVADLDRLEVSAPTPTVPMSEGPPADVAIRPATPLDAASFLDLYRDVAAEGRWIQTERVARPARFYRRRFRRSWTNAGANLVAVEEGRVVGSLSIRRDEHPATRHVASLGMFVAAAWRGRRVGTALMEEALRWAREQGVEKLELTVYPHNAAAIALYRRFGFTDEGVLSGHSRKPYGHEDEILMGLWLGERGA
jgi:diaminopimelate decarboxylase